MGGVFFAFSSFVMRSWGDRPATLLVVGTTVYLVGVIGLTIAYNVPLNDALAKLDPGSVDAAARWTSYVERWTRANHVRTASSLAAAAAFTLALRA